MILSLFLFWPKVEQPKELKPCRPHSWSIREQDDKYVCLNCGYVAGTFKSENGEY